MGTKTKDIILVIFGLYPFIQLYRNIKISVRKLFCKHEWRYWKMHLHCTQHNGIDDTILTRWRKCECCGKKQEMNMLPGNWHWEKSYDDLPEDSDTIHFDVDINNGLSKRRETLSDKRDKKLNQLFK